MPYDSRLALTNSQLRNQGMRGALEDFMGFFKAKKAANDDAEKTGMQDQITQLGQPGAEGENPNRARKLAEVKAAYANKYGAEPASAEDFLAKDAMRGEEVAKIGDSQRTRKNSIETDANRAGFLGKVNADATLSPTEQSFYSMKPEAYGDRLKPVSNQLFIGADGNVVPASKKTGLGPDGKPIMAMMPMMPEMPEKGSERIRREAKARAEGAAEGAAVSPPKKAKLPASTVLELSGAQEAIAQLNQMMGGAKDLKKDYGPFNGLRTMNPYDTEAQDFNQLIATTKQVIGKGLEGGVLRKEDEAKYEKIIPTFGDTKEVRQNKAQQLEQMIINKHNTQLKTLNDANYDTGDIPQAVTKTEANDIPVGTIKINKQGAKVRKTATGWEHAE